MHTDERDLADLSGRHPELGGGGLSAEEQARLEAEEPAAPATQADRRVNLAIPVLVATSVFGSAPTSVLPKGTEPSPQSELSQRYINQTVPILEIIDFHECISVIGELSPTVRLLIGCGALAMGIVLVKPRKPKERGIKPERRPSPKKEERGPVTMEPSDA